MDEHIYRALAAAVLLRDQLTEARQDNTLALIIVSNLNAAMDHAGIRPPEGTAYQAVEDGLVVTGFKMT